MSNFPCRQLRWPMLHYPKKVFDSTLSDERDACDPAARNALSRAFHMLGPGYEPCGSNGRLSDNSNQKFSSY